MAQQQGHMAPFGVASDHFCSWPCEMQGLEGQQQQQMRNGPPGSHIQANYWVILERATLLGIQATFPGHC